jgi:hypothetical protein
MKIHLKDTTYTLGKQNIPTSVGGTAVVKFPNGTIRNIQYKSVMNKLVAKVEIYGLILDVPLIGLNVIKVNPDAEKAFDYRKYKLNK